MRAQAVRRSACLVDLGAIRAKSFEIVDVVDFWAICNDPNGVCPNEVILVVEKSICIETGFEMYRMDGSGERKGAKIIASTTVHRWLSKFIDDQRQQSLKIDNFPRFIDPWKQV